MALGLTYRCWPLPGTPADLTPQARRFVLLRGVYLSVPRDGGAALPEQDHPDDV